MICRWRWASPAISAMRASSMLIVRSWPPAPTTRNGRAWAVSATSSSSAAMSASACASSSAATTPTSWRKPRPNAPRRFARCSDGKEKGADPQAGAPFPPRSRRLFGLRLLHRLLHRIDHVARFERGRRQHDLLVRIFELLDAVAADVLELHLEHPRLRPFAFLAELDVAIHRLEGVRADVVGDLLLIEALRLRHGLGQDLHVGVRDRRHVIAERIDARRLRLRLVLL